MLSLPQLKTYHCSQGHPILTNIDSPAPLHCGQCTAKPEEISVYSRDPNAISYSMFQTFGTCPRLAWFEYELGLTATEGDTSAMDAGTLIHAGLAKWYSSTTKKRERIEEGIAAIREMYFQRGFNRYIPEVGGKGERRALDIILKVFVEYLKHYYNENMAICLDSSGKPLTEINFAWKLTLPGDTREQIAMRPMLRGVIDGIYEWDGRLYIVDHKITSLINQGNLTKLRVSDQLTTYVWVIRDMLKLDVQHAMVNVIGMFKNVQPERHFVRIPTQRNADAVAEWKIATLRRWQRYQYNRQYNLWDRETEACGQYRRPCSFVDPCYSQDPEMMRQKLMGRYRVNMRKMEEVRATVGED